MMRWVTWSEDHLVIAPSTWIVFVDVIFNWPNWVAVNPSNKILNFWISESAIDPIVA